MGSAAISLIVAVARHHDADRARIGMQHRQPRDPVWRRVLLAVRPKT